MKNSSIFVLIFIGFLAAVIHGESSSTTESVTDEVTTTAGGADTQATDAPTTDSGSTGSQTGGVTDVSGGTTPEPATGVSSGTEETNAPQSTVPSGSTAAPPTSAPTCPQQDIFLVKDGSPTFSVTVPAGLSCPYYARSTSFSKSITIDNPITLDGATVKITGDDGVVYDSSDSSPPSPPIPSHSSQIEINVLTTTAAATVSLQLILEEDQCTTNPCQHGGTCSVIQGQETCTCVGCYVGARCETLFDPCVTYALVCNIKTPPQKCQADANCTPTCVASP